MIQDTTFQLISRTKNPSPLDHSLFPEVCSFTSVENVTTTKQNVKQKTLNLSLRRQVKTFTLYIILHCFIMSEGRSYLPFRKRKSFDLLTQTQDSRFRRNTINQFENTYLLVGVHSLPIFSLISSFYDPGSQVTNSSQGHFRVSDRPQGPSLLKSPDPTPRDNPRIHSLTGPRSPT